MQAWILSLILLLAPKTPSGTAQLVAGAIAKVSVEHPVYSGEDGPVRTAAQLVAVAYFESTFRLTAVNHEPSGDSIGLAQVSVSNLKALGLERDDLFDPEKNLIAAATLMRGSHRMCGERPLEERLAHYASGGPTCDVAAGLRASRLRMKLARRLFETLL